jgi:hypothetical protein
LEYHPEPDGGGRPRGRLSVDRKEAGQHLPLVGERAQPIELGVAGGIRAAAILKIGKCKATGLRFLQRLGTEQFEGTIECVAQAPGIDPDGFTGVLERATSGGRWR